MGGLIQSSAGMLLTEGGQCVMERKRREKEKQCHFRFYSFCYSSETSQCRGVLTYREVLDQSRC